MSEKETAKRKTTTSNEVKKRYNDKTYTQYSIKLRNVEDADIISLIESRENKGIPNNGSNKKPYTQRHIKIEYEK